MRTKEQIQKDYDRYSLELAELYQTIRISQDKIDVAYIQLRKLKRELSETKLKDEHIENHFPEKAP